MREILIHAVAGSELPLAWQGDTPFVAVAIAARTDGTHLVLGVTGCRPIAGRDESTGISCQLPDRPALNWPRS
jgi:hypothetical protein